MHVRLEILDGPQEGQSFAFDLPEGEEVRVGRDSERCQVVFSSDYAGVSRQHCALRSVLGRVRLRTNKENAVLLGMQPAWDDTVLADGGVMQLGHGGPRMAIAVRYPAGRDVAAPASTIAFKPDGQPDGAAPEVELQRETVQVAGQIRSHQRRTWLFRSVLALTVLVGVWFSIEARADTALLRQAVLDDGQRQAVLELIEARQEVRPEMADIAARVADSVYCVMKRTERGDQPVGTAWVVDRKSGLVATNAHVAEEFEAGKTFLRGSGARSTDLPIAAARSHPAYAEFGEQLGRYCQALEMTGADSSTRTMRGYDVALLVVEEAARAGLAPDLALLPVGSEAEIATGGGCATVGFPAEGIGFHPERPQHKTHLGHVVAVTDYFMAAAADQASHLIHTSLPVAGGASGSPLVDDRGRVIGLISSANVVHSAEGRRIPLAGTTCAQRVDTLRGLLEGRVEDDARTAAWEENFRAAVKNAKKSMEQVLIETFEQLLRRRGMRSEVQVASRDQIELAWDAKTGATIKTVEIEAPRTGAYLCCVIADDVLDVDLTVFLPGGKQMDDRSPDWFPSVAFSMQAGETVRIAAFRDGQQPTGATILLLQQAP
ncbi:MAG: trypsin-like peptidase domain-containing protein [bacterium]|nr:trypsin-like peptidase domain-containing protein [bacterium]